MTNRKYECKICDAEFEHESDEPIDKCLKCDGQDEGPGEDNWHDVEHVHKCPYCDLWMVCEFDGCEVCPRCNSFFEDYEGIAHTLRCLAFYDERTGDKATARKVIAEFEHYQEKPWIGMFHSPTDALETAKDIMHEAFDIEEEK